MHFQTRRGRGSLFALLAALVLAGPTAAADDDVSEINISQFVFRDTNRNGRFDLGEQPYAGAMVGLEQENKDTIVRYSNINGFTNFKLSMGTPDREISEPGELVFTIVPPYRWTLTTPPAAVVTTARALPGSPGGLVIDPTLRMAGIAPDPVLYGALAEGGSVSCTSTPSGADGGTAEVDTDLDGAFACLAAPGRWQVAWDHPDRPSSTRTVEIGEWPVQVAAPLDGPAEPAPVLKVATFDDLTTSDTLLEIPGNYRDVGWWNMVGVHQQYYKGNGYVNGTVSREYAAYNSSGHPAGFFSDRPFDFVGAFVSVAWPAAEDAHVIVRAFRGDTMVAEERFYAEVDGPVWFDADWRGIDRVEFSHETYWQVVLDDVTFRTGAEALQ